MKIETQATAFITGTPEEISAALQKLENPIPVDTKEGGQEFIQGLYELREMGVSFYYKNKIGAIKVVRQKTGWGLSETKDWVETHMIRD